MSPLTWPSHIQFTTRELNYLWLFFLVLVLTIRMTISSKEAVIMTLFFAALALAVAWISTGGTTLGQELRRAQNMTGAVSELYEKNLRAKIPEFIWEEHVCIERPETLHHCLTDASILRALQTVYDIYLEYDIDAVGKIFALTEAFFALYAVELTSDKTERIDDLMDIRRTLLNFVHTLVISRGPPTYNDMHWAKLEQVFTARTYKCMNNLSNKKKIAYKNPHGYSKEVVDPRHSFHVVI